MRRRGIVLVAMLAVIGVAAATVALALLAASEGPRQADVLAGGEEIRVTTRLEPRLPAFGDTVRATVDVVLDPRRVAPESVRIAAELAPWELVVRPREERRRVGGAIHARVEYLVRCTTGPCLPGGAMQALRLPPARVSYTTLGGPEERRVVR
ncbi:MAG: hypothetical protein NZL88_10790, partial [Gaiellaceae bacterium]|nr:hypothetical protein [Gaiellaceae bacterium]